MIGQMVGWSVGAMIIIDMHGIADVFSFSDLIFYQSPTQLPCIWPCCKVDYLKKISEYRCIRLIFSRAPAVTPLSSMEHFLSAQNMASLSSLLPVRILCPDMIFHSLYFVLTQIRVGRWSSIDEYVQTVNDFGAIWALARLCYENVLSCLQCNINEIQSPRGNIWSVVPLPCPSTLAVME